MRQEELSAATRGKLAQFFFNTVETDGSRFLSSSARLTLLAFLPVAIFFFIGHFIAVSRALVVLDYFLLLFLVPWVHRYIIAVVFVALLIVDIFLAMAPGYHFTYSSALDSLASIPYLNVTSLMTYGLFIAIGIPLVIWFVSWLTGRDSQKIGANLLLLFLGYCIYIADAGLSPNNSRRNVQAATEINIASSVAQSLKRNFEFANKGSKKPAAYNVESASTRLFERISEGVKLPPRIVVVVVESLSTFNDESINNTQMAALNDERLAGRYRVVRGRVAFKGSTVPAELRELCRVDVSAVLPDVSLLPVADCLPQRLANFGYKSVAFHGFSGFFFNRRAWYPKLGFGEVHFMPDIDRQLGVKQRCGSTFRANCDHLITGLIKNKLMSEAHSKLFLYWLTVNGHLPVADTELIDHAVDCSTHGQLLTHPALCASVKIGDSVFRDLVRLALEEDLPETLFVIVGDHMAPYLSKPIRATLSEQFVPYALLVPRSLD